MRILPNGFRRDGEPYQPWGVTKTSKVSYVEHPRGTLDEDIFSWACFNAEGCLQLTKPLRIS